MSAAIPHCKKCDLDCLFVRVGTMGNDKGYGVMWRCPHCAADLLDMCVIGPVIPTPQACINCGATLPNLGDFTACPECKLTRLESLDMFGLVEPPADPIATATQWFALGLVRRAIATVNHALIRIPTLENGWMIKYSFLSSLGYHNPALIVIEAAMDHIVNPELIISYGYTLQALGRDREAIDAYKEYLVTAPKGEFAGAALSNAANSWRKLNNDGEAEKLYLQAIAIDPTHIAHYASYIRLLFDQKRFDDAERVIEQAMAFAPDNATIARLLEDQSVICVEKMRGEDALRFAQAAIDRGASGTRAIYLRGRALALLGRFDESRNAIQQVLKLDPKNTDGLRAMKMLEEAAR